ncbi:MAG: hypothetical protein AAF682_06635 [Planctomycetota bacterium]
MRRLMGGAALRFRSGALASVVSNVVGAGGQVVLVPAFLAAWGEQRYGEWLTLAAAVAYASFADLGLATYVTNRLNALRAREEMAEYARVLHSALALSLVLSGCMMAVLAAGLWGAPLAAWFRFEDTPGSTAALASIVLAAQAVVSIPRGLVLGLYRTIGEYARGTHLANLQRVAYVGATLGTLALGAGLVEVAAAQLATAVAAPALALFDLARRHPDLPLGLGRRDRALARSLVRPSVHFLAIQVSLIGVLQGSTLLVSSLFGAGAVAVFVSLRTLANFVRQAGGALSNAAWPELTRLSAAGAGGTLREVHRLKVKLLWALTLGAAAFLRLTGEELFAAWTGGRLAFDALLFDAFLLWLVAQAPWTASSYVLLASNRHERLAVRQLAAAVLGLAGGAWLARWLGPAGLLVGLAGAELALCGLFVPRRVCAVTGDDPARFLREVYGRGVLASLAMVLLVVLGDAWIGAAGPLARIFAGALLAGGGLLLVAVPFWLTPHERRRAAELLSPRLGRLLPAEVRR